MQFTKPMIDLVFEVRRLSPSELKPAIKLANPELFDELKKLYYQQKSAVLKALIKELFALAGGDWPARLLRPTTQPIKQKVNVYRGQVMHQDSPPKNNSTANKEASQSRKRIYRGQVVV